MVTCTKDHPINLWSIIYGMRVCSYVAYNDKDELIAPVTVVFDPSGERIYSGYLNCIRIFRVARPGRDYEELRLTPSRKSKEGQKGLMASIAFSPDGLYAVGSYSGELGIYSEKTHEPLALFDSQHTQGISQISFSPEGYYLVSSGRKDAWLTLWDIRVTGRELYHFERPLNTHQRTRFSMQGNSLAVGDQVSLLQLINIQVM